MNGFDTARLALVAAVALAGYPAARAATPVSANFGLPSSTLNAGGGSMGSANFRMSSSLGDSTATGSMFSGAFKLSSGFWGFLATSVRQTVVEYLDTVDFPESPGGHYFYSSDPDEQAAVDRGAAGAFFRTGRQFLTGGSTPVCRFYGSMSPGPNSHFFTVDAAECSGLRAAQVTPTPTTVQQWNFEGLSYSTTPATVGPNGVRSCPSNTAPLYRAYNNAYPLSGPKNPWDSNHRFTPQLSDVAQMVALGWRDEGIVFCTAQ